MYTGTVYLLSFMFICLNWTLTASSTYTIGKAQTLNYAHTDTHTHTHKTHNNNKTFEVYRNPKKNKYNSSQDKTKKKQNAFFFLSRFSIFLPFFEELLSKLYIFPYSFFVLFCFSFSFGDDIIPVRLLYCCCFLNFD
jgi:hypothetical protein